VEARSTLSALPPELLNEVVVMLPCSTYKGAIVVSRYWCKTLDNEVHWERLCRWQWPGVTHNVSNSWRKFALLDGGGFLGAFLLQHLKATCAVALSCGASYFGQCCMAEVWGLHCDACGDTSIHGMRVWSCRGCNYKRCSKCYKAVQPPAAITNGATNHSSKDGWSALHYACRLGFKDVVNSLLHSRAHIECRDYLHGYTPLMVGATHGHGEVCSLLLERGAAKDTRNNYAKTAAHCARAWGHVELLELLGQTQ